jgi:hypothetical protein
MHGTTIKIEKADCIFNYAGDNNGIYRTVEGTSRGFIGQIYRTYYVLWDIVWF